MDKLNADILFLEEVEDCEALEALRIELKDAAQYRSVFVQGGDRATGQDVVLLTKVGPVKRLAVAFCAIATR